MLVVRRALGGGRAVEVVRHPRLMRRGKMSAVFKGYGLSDQPVDEVMSPLSTVRVSDFEIHEPVSVLCRV